MNARPIYKFNPELKVHMMLLGITICFFIWSAINPFDTESWFLLALTPTILVIGLVCLYPHYQFSTFLYVILCVHVIVLLIGAKYTYTANPFFDWLRELFEFKRNGYDRVGHLMQGFTPALMAKEVFLRKEKMMRNRMFYFYVLSISLSVSALYELLEFAATLVTNMPGETILGIQGDLFDTHKDILMAFLGWVGAMTFFGPFHDRQINKMDRKIT